MTNTLEQVLNFDDADLASNRLGQLTQKQKDLLAEKAKSHKSFNNAIGVFIALMFAELSPEKSIVETHIVSYKNLAFGE